MTSLTSIVERLKTAYEDKKRKVPYRCAESNKWVDTLLIGSSKERVIHEWVEILKEESSISQIAIASSIGRYAILVPDKLEEQLRPIIEQCLPGLRYFYENIESPKEFPDFPDHSMSINWYTVDSNNFIRLVSAATSNEELRRSLNKIGLNCNLEDSYLDSLTSYQKGCLESWAITIDLFRSGSRKLCETRGVDILPEFFKSFVPDKFLKQIKDEDISRLPHGVKEIRETEYLIEADHDKSFYLWQEWALQAKRMCERVEEKHERVTWEQGIGITEQIGTLDERPVMITVFWNKINGHQIGFWSMESQVTDHKMAEEWLEKTFPKIPRKRDFVQIIRNLQASEK